MWLFRRSRRSEPDGGTTDVESDTADHETYEPSRANDDWAHLEPITRITGPAPTVISRTFDRELTTWHPQTIMRRLDHALTLDAPAGVVTVTGLSVADQMSATPPTSGSAGPPAPAVNPASGAVAQRRVNFEPPRRPAVTIAPQLRSISTIEPEPGVTASEPPLLSSPSDALGGGAMSEAQVLDGTRGSAADEPLISSLGLAGPPSDAEVAPASPLDPPARSRPPTVQVADARPPLTAGLSEVLDGDPASAPIDLEGERPAQSSAGGAPTLGHDVGTSVALAGPLPSLQRAPDRSRPPRTLGLGAPISMPDDDAPAPVHSSSVQRRAEATIGTPDDGDSAHGPRRDPARGAEHGIASSPRNPTIQRTLEAQPLSRTPSETTASQPPHHAADAGIETTHQPVSGPAAIETEHGPSLRPADPTGDWSSSAHAPDESPLHEPSAAGSIVRTDPSTVDAEPTRPLVTDSALEVGGSLETQAASDAGATASQVADLQLEVQRQSVPSWSEHTPDARLTTTQRTSSRSAVSFGRDPIPMPTPPPPTAATAATAATAMIQRSGVVRPVDSTLSADVQRPSSGASHKPPATMETTPLIDVFHLGGTARPRSLGDVPSTTAQPLRAGHLRPVTGLGFPAPVDRPTSLTSDARTTGSSPSTIVQLDRATPLATGWPTVRRDQSSAPPSSRATPVTTGFGEPHLIDAGSVAVEAGVAQRQADGSVVFDLAAARPPDPMSDESAETVTLQREATSEATPRTAPPAAGAAPQTDLDELARHLYGRLRLMLKHELRLDRERAGLWTEARR